MNKKNDRLLLAANAFSRRNYRVAAQLLREELDVSEKKADILWWLAKAEFAISIIAPTANDESGHEAIMHIKQAIAIKSDDARYYYCLGDMYTHVAPPDYINAAVAFRKALKFTPSFYPALSALASLYGVPENVVSLPEAIVFCKKALSINPTRSLWLTLARLYEYAGEDYHAYEARLNSKFEWHDTAVMKY